MELGEIDFLILTRIEEAGSNTTLVELGESC